MKYLLLIKDTQGKTHLESISENMEITVAPGDDIVVMDEDGKPVDVSLRPEEEDLLIQFPGDIEVVLKDFYDFEDWSNPVTISLNPVEPEEAEYEFNSQTGNLPNSRGFTLMRFSNVENIQFVEEFEPVDLGTFNGASSGSGNNEESEEVEEALPIADPQTTVVNQAPNTAPTAADDAAVTGQNSVVAINVLGNDVDPDPGDALIVTGVDQPALGSVTVDSNGQIVFDPGSDFDGLDAGESATVSFDYAIADGNGGTDTATVTVTVNGADDATETAPDEGHTDENTAVVIDVLGNDSDPDASDNPLSVASVTQPVNGTVTNNGNNVTFDPGAAFQSLAVGESATVSFTYTTNTGATENVTVTVHGKNNAPVAVDDAAVTDQNTSILIDAIANDFDPDTSDDLIIQGVDQPTLGSASVDGNNQIVFDPGDDFDDLDVGESAVVTFNYLVSDGSGTGGVDTATVTVTVNGVDDATVTAPDAAITDENTPVVIDVLANDSDVDTSDNPLSVASVTQPGVGLGSVAVTNAGADVTFDPGTDFDYLAVGESTTVDFTYTTDTGVTENVTVTINGVNDAPDAIDDAGTTDQDTSVTIDVLDNDIDPDTSDALIITGVDQPALGSVSVNADNEIVFDPGSDFDNLDVGESATVTFDYTISDGNGGSDVATVTVTVDGVEDATVTAPDTGVTDEDTAINIDVLANDSDVDANDNPLSIASVTQPASGLVTNNGNDVTFDPNGEFESLAVGESATVTFTYTTDTGATENVTVTVNGANDAPDAMDDADTTNQGVPVTIDVLGNDTDPDNDTLEVTGVSQPTQGSVTYNSGDVTFDPGSDFDSLDAGESATVSFTYDISDGNGGTDTATVTVTVNGTDDATETAPDAAITDENTPVVIDVLANDSDVDTSDNPLSVASVTQPGLNMGSVAVTNAGADVTFDPGTDFDYLAVGESTTVDFTYTTDTGVTENVTVTVNGVNDAPAAVDDAGVTDQNTAIMIDAVANDLDPDTSDELIIAGVDQPTRGSVAIDGSNQLVFDPGDDFDDLDVGESATVTFDYNITDGNGGTDTATVTVTVNGTEDATVTAPDAAVTNEDTAINIDVLTNDSDPDSNDNPLTVASISQPADTDDGVVVNNTNDVTFTPGSNFQSLSVGESATTTFTYTTNTGEVETVTVTVNGVNDAPAAADDAATTDQNTSITIDTLVNDTDPDNNDSLLITGVTQPTRGTVTYNVGDVTFDPGDEFDDLDTGESATVTFTYDITDGNGGTDTATVTVTVNGTEDATVTAPDVAVTNEDTAVTIDVLDNDSDPDTSDNPLTVASVAQPADTDDGVVVNNTNDVTFTPGSNFNSLAVGESATTTFTYTTNTGAVETVTVTVNGVNDAPTANPDSDTTDQNTAVTIDVIANDVDPDTSDALVVTSVSQPTRGAVSINADNDVIFDPDGAFNDLDTGESATVTFDYAISDGNGGTDTTTVTVTINGTDDATNTAPDAAVTDEDSAVTIDVLVNDSDPDTSDNPLTVASVAQPADTDDGVVVNNTTDVTFTPGSNFNSLAVGESATTTFTYTTSTGATETVTVTVNGVNDAPMAVDDADSTDQETAVTIDVLANDLDPDTSDVLEITGITQPSKGTVTYNSGDLTFDPGSEFDDLGLGVTETVTFTYSMTDGNGGTDTATVTVTVTGTDDATLTNPDAEETNQGVAVTIDVLANDSDIDVSDNPLTIASVAQPADTDDGVVVNNTTDVTFTPGSNFDSLAAGESGTTTFTYTTNTGATETATVTVWGTNDGPTAVDDAGSTNQDASVVIDVLANDSDPDASDSLLITSVDQPLKGTTLINSSNQIVFDPGDEFDDLDAGETATVTFDYNISDGNGGTDTATVTVTVSGLDDATATTPDEATTFEGSPVTLNVVNNDSDPDTSDNPLVVASVSQPADTDDGTASFSGGEVTFTPGSNFDSLSFGESATTTFTYTTNTGATETVTITVNGLNDPTVTAPDQDTTNEDTAVTIDVLANDSDPDTVDNPLSISFVTQPIDTSDGTVVNNGSNVTFTPGSKFQALAVGESATTTFTYTTDTGVNEDVTVTILGVNDAPTPQDDYVVSTTDIVPVVIDVVSNDTDIDGTIDPSTVDLDLTTAGIQNTLNVVGEGVWTTDGSGNVIFTPDAGITDQPTAITYGVADNNGATGVATVTLRYSAADVWFGNDESGSVDNSEFPESRDLISGAANLMSFATGDLAFNAALYSWSGTSQQTMVQNLTADQTDFVNTSSSYSRNYSNLTDLGQAIVYGTQQINASVTAKQLASDPRADVPQVLVILTDASSGQIFGDTSLVSDVQAAKADGIILVFVLIDEAQDDPSAVAYLENLSSKDQNNDPLVVTAETYADIDSGEIADLLNAIREAAAAGLLPPVVIDLDGDGVEFDGVEDGIKFDVDGDGVDEQVAWADEDDAVLVYDANDNNLVDSVDEVAFAQYSDERNATDLDGLRTFDTNDDLILDANDAEFDAFKLWQDRDGDGIVDEGEMMTLSEAGIESIGLTSDESTYYTAGGDVRVHGEGTVNYADGSQGKFADAEFQYDELTDDSELHVVTDNGDVMDVNDAGEIQESAGEDLLEGADNETPADEGNAFETGGATSSSSGEEDAAAADAAMS